MAYTTYSTHAQTGADSTSKIAVTSNEYAPEGRTAGYPNKFSLYAINISTVDGSTQVASEPHTVDEIIGSRLYLKHRPLVDPTGGIGVITSTQGTILPNNTNAAQGYIEYSNTDKPTSDFEVTYTAAPDCFTQWQFNTLQDDMMEVQNKLGPTNATGWYGVRNPQMAIFDAPNDSWNDLLPNLVSLPHLRKDITISSTPDDTLTGTLGERHQINLGRKYDTLKFEGTGFTMGSVDGFTPDHFAEINLSNRTGDHVHYAGTFSGFDQMTIGGPGSEIAGYSGVVFSEDMTGNFVTGAMLRVFGDIACFGAIKSIGTLTVITSTGETSTILGDFTIRDELFVHGVSHLIGPTITNDLTVKRDISLYGNLVAKNLKGAGERGHTLIDGLDASEVQHTYKTITRKSISNYIISAPSFKDNYPPKKSISSASYQIDPTELVGDEFVLTGFFTQAASTSGEHPSILQLQWALGDVYYISGHFTGGIPGAVDGGWWSKGMIDPGSLWIEVLDGEAAGYKAPIYAFTVEETANDSQLIKLNAFTPKQPDNPIAATVDTFALYSPGCEHFGYITAAGGATPNFTVTATASDPLRIAFEDEVRIFDTTTNRSLRTALKDSVSGLGANASNIKTGVAYIFATRNNIDIEAIPDFVTRATPFRMPGETIIGEVTASWDGSDTSWSIEEATSYRPGAKYDSSWIPISKDRELVLSGRMISKFDASPATTGNRFYFNHNLGADLTFADVSANLYLASYGTGDSSAVNANKYHSNVHGLWGADWRTNIGNTGMFTKLALSDYAADDSEKEASVFYMDGKLIGIQFTEAMLDAPRGIGDATTAEYLRLIITRNS